MDGDLDYRGVGCPHNEVNPIEKIQPFHYKMQCQPAARSLQHAVLGQKWSSTKSTYISNISIIFQGSE